MKKSILILGLILLLVASLASVAVAHTDKTYSWYCVRNKEHKQPRLDAEVRFVEEYNAYYVDKKHGDREEKKVVYLTFDAGYENENVLKVLDILKRENVPGAFFVLGHLIEKNAELIKRMNEDGHIVCNHTYSHKDPTRCTESELMEELHRLERAYETCTGRTMPKYFRPPEGRFSLDTLKTVSEQGYKTIFWSFAYADWDNDKQMSPEAAKEKILSNIHNGAIILLHPTSSTNAMILRDVIQTLKESGYEFGTLDQLVL